MELMFKWQDIKMRGRGLTFDDVLLVPRKSEVRSRRDPSLQSKLTKNITLEMPILSANMDTVTETEMALAMNDLGGLGVFHRFASTETQVGFVEALKDSGVKTISASIGVNEDDHARAKSLLKAGVNLITIDIAHGHSVAMIETMQRLKDLNPDVEILAGNVATADATEELILNGASAIKVGIGPGSMCTTRIITGCGVPQLTAIAMCAEVGRKHGVPIVADGGLRTSGDIVKAFAAGASVVMLGSMLAGTIESPGEIKHGKKLYRGMASRSAQDSWRGGVPKGMAPEGESHQISIKGHVRDVILELAGGIRSGMSYLNANSIAAIADNAQFLEMSSSGVSESRAHGLNF